MSSLTVPVTKKTSKLSPDCGDSGITEYESMVAPMGRVWSLESGGVGAFGRNMATAARYLPCKEMS